MTTDKPSKPVKQAPKTTPAKPATTRRDIGKSIRESTDISNTHKPPPLPKTKKK